MQMHLLLRHIVICNSSQCLACLQIRPVAMAIELRLSLPPLELGDEAIIKTSSRAWQDNKIPPIILNLSYFTWMLSPSLLTLISQE